MNNVILVPGFNGAPIIYEWFKSELTAKGYKVTILDTPLRDAITWKGYEEAFDKIKDLLPDSIIVAHSIGCAMTVKYLAANDIRAKAYISLAGFPRAFETPNRPDLDKGVLETTFDDNTGRHFAELVENRYSIFSDNDHIVPRELLEEFPMMIRSQAIFIPNVGHMGRKAGLTEFPEALEIIERIK